jgi:hypothetical protein
MIIIYDNLIEFIKLIIIDNYQVKELTPYQLYYYGILLGFGIVLMIKSDLLDEIFILLIS